MLPAISATLSPDLAGSLARGFGLAQRGRKSFSWSSVRSLVNGLNRVDNFPYAGGLDKRQRAIHHKHHEYAEFFGRAAPCSLAV